MSKLKSSDLVSSFQKRDISSYRKEEHEKMLSSYSKEQALESAEKILKDIALKENDLLNRGIRSAVIGAIYGMFERQLDPFHVNHIGIYRLIERDVEEAFDFVSQGDIDLDLWLFETFDFGIKHVYYLDWQLYLSKICY
ncbi:MAG TPA: hypothetical protein PL048_20375 [Leptospiraceae bacterium]|nr:hypothetical protein [Leptospiraceae bacterium]HMZ61143.1 hypothetical protein [Leptospiraceae bacterium]HNF15652.1 hypothetical protein [Leptospiraceae bacterium]HNF26931.1 hypothetical protein [Leptospiraceae bacterium]HNI99917.1 hypothetical protein [Leptospiraceae bacterium]